MRSYEEKLRHILGLSCVRLSSSGDMLFTGILLLLHIFNQGFLPFQIKARALVLNKLCFLERDADKMARKFWCLLLKTLIILGGVVLCFNLPFSNRASREQADGEALGLGIRLTKVKS